MLRKAYVLEDPQTKRNKPRSGYLTLACRGPKRRWKSYVTLSGVPNKGEENQKWLPHPYLLGGPTEGGNATSPLHSRGSPTKGNKIRSGYLTLAFSGGTKEGGNATSPLHSWGPPTKGNKIRSGCRTLAFSGGPKEGGNAT